MGLHKSMCTIFKRSFAQWEVVGKLSLLCFLIMQLSHRGMFSINEGKPCTKDCFCNWLKLWYGKWPYWLCHKTISIVLEILCTCKFTLLISKGNNRFGVIWTLDTSSLLGCLPRMVHETSSNITLYPFYVNCPTCIKLCDRLGT